MKLRIMSRNDIKRAVNMDAMMKTVESVYRYKAEGKTIVWPTVFHDFETGRQDMDIKSGYIMGEEIHGLKVINWTQANLEKGLPDLVGLILVFETATGLPLGLLDASFVTGLRTGCAGAVGAKYLARKNSRTLLMLGTGAQSRFLLGVFLKQFPELNAIYVANTVHPENGIQYVQTVREWLYTELQIDSGHVAFHPVCNESELAQAVGTSDIIVTATPARTPVIRKDWVKPGTHFSCIGADMPGKEEIDPELFRGAVIYCDDFVHCVEAGELELPVKHGVITTDDVRGEIGDLILGKTCGRSSDADITIYDAAGMALLDIAAAKAALRLAEQEGLGEVVEL